MCRVIQELFQRWHVHRLKEQFDVSHARFDLEDDFFVKQFAQICT